jgi:hypothetical protein
MKTLSSATIAKLMPENFPADQFLRKADKSFGACIVN